MSFLNNALGDPARSQADPGYIVQMSDPLLNLQKMLVLGVIVLQIKVTNLNLFMKA